MGYYCLIFYTAQTKNSFDAQLYDIVAFTSLGEFLSSELFKNYQEEAQSLYQYYLDDYVNSVYQTTRESEIKVHIILWLYVATYFIYL